MVTSPIVGVGQQNVAIWYNGGSRKKGNNDEGPQLLVDLSFRSSLDIFLRWRPLQHENVFVKKKADPDAGDDMMMMTNEKMEWYKKQSSNIWRIKCCCIRKKESGWD